MTCNRFEEEGLLLLERGETLPEHFRSCPECQRTQAAYQSLKASLGELHVDATPEPGWQAAILQRVRQNSGSAGPDDSAKPENQRSVRLVAANRPVQPSPQVTETGSSRGEVVPTSAPLAREASRRGAPHATRWLAAAAAVAAVSTTVFYYGRTTPDLDISVRNGDVVYRAEQTAQVGSTLNLDATVGRRAFQLRVYRDGRELLFSCSDAPPCQRGVRMVSAQVSLQNLGTYRGAVFLSDSALPTPTGDLDRDVLLARESDVQVILSPEVTVR